MTTYTVEQLRSSVAGRYRIERELGAGGMATVYLAEDLKHKRRVAVKVLKPELAAVLGAERFVQEITTTAALQHPHILPLFDSGEADGFLYYVMPFIDGETLRAKLDRETQLGIDESVMITKAVADALDYAHRHGVIHRDIKPENILLHEGRPMVADFGIALAVSAAAGGRMTETGLSLGTPHYMSPEQATADREITARSDIYSLGSVLYEMLAGDPPHTGASAQQIIMKIITEPAVPVTTLRKSVPANISAALEKALEKLPADRFENANAFAAALADPGFMISHPAGARTRLPIDSGARSTVPLVAIALAAIAIGAWGWLRPTAGPRTTHKMVIAVPRLSRVDYPVLSPIGDEIVFIGDGRLWVRTLSDLDARPLEGTDDARAPFWSPDGHDIGYFVGARVFRVPAAGGAPALVTTIDFACPMDAVCGGAWTDDGRMLLSSGFKELLVVADRGGQARSYLEPKTAEHFHSVSALPKGRGAVFEVDPDHGPDRVDIWDGHVRRTLAEPASLPRYVEPGFVLFRRGEGVWAVRLDGVAAAGDPFPVADRADFASASRDGALLYKSRGDYDETLIWVDRSGAMREAVTTDGGVAHNPALSPDESRIAFDGKSSIRIHAPARGVRMSLGDGADSIQLAPVWSAAGDRIYYTSMHPGGHDQEDSRIRSIVPGAAAPTAVVDSGSDPAISSDGHYLTFTTGNVSNENIWYRDLRAPESATKAFDDSPQFTGSLRLSSDSRLAAFVAGDWKSGGFEVYVSRFPGGEERTQVSSGGVRYNSRVTWSATGDRLYYVRETDGALMETDVRPDRQIQLSTPRMLFSEETADIALNRGYATSRDSTRFLVVRRTVKHGGQAQAFVMIDDWRASKPATRK